MSETNGGPAFPGRPYLSAERTGPGQFTTTSDEGMSLRDYFAAAAMQGLTGGAELWDGVETNLHAPSLAKSAYRIADEMLKERNRKPD